MCTCDQKLRKLFSASPQIIRFQRFRNNPTTFIYIYIRALSMLEIGKNHSIRDEGFSNFLSKVEIYIRSTNPLTLHYTNNVSPRFA